MRKSFGRYCLPKWVGSNLKYYKKGFNLPFHNAYWRIELPWIGEQLFTDNWWLYKQVSTALLWPRWRLSERRLWRNYLLWNLSLTTASHLTNISHYEIKQAGIGYDSAFHFTQACLNSSCQTRDITGPSKFAWLCIYWQQLHFLMALK